MRYRSDQHSDALRRHLARGPFETACKLGSAEITDDAVPDDATLVRGMLVRLPAGGPCFPARGVTRASPAVSLLAPPVATTVNQIARRLL